MELLVEIQRIMADFQFEPLNQLTYSISCLRIFGSYFSIQGHNKKRLLIKSITVKVFTSNPLCNVISKFLHSCVNLIFYVIQYKNDHSLIIRNIKTYIDRDWSIHGWGHP